VLNGAGTAGTNGQGEFMQVNFRLSFIQF